MLHCATFPMLQTCSSQDTGTMLKHATYIQGSVGNPDSLTSLVTKDVAHVDQ